MNSHEEIVLWNRIVEIQQDVKLVMHAIQGLYDRIDMLPMTMRLKDFEAKDEMD